MTADDLKEFALAAGLSHAALAARLADYVGINLRTTERYISGRNAVPDWLSEKVMVLGEILIAEYQERIDKIKSFIS